MAPSRVSCARALVFGVALAASRAFTNSIGNRPRTQHTLIHRPGTFRTLPLRVTTPPTPYDEPLSLDTRAKVSIGSTPQFAIPGDSTEETLSQHAIFYAHWALTFANLYKSSTMLQLSSPTDCLTLAAFVGFSVVLGDFATGVFHWSVDNYGSIRTPVFGAVCAAFQGHHVTPWTITFRSFINNVYKICVATVPFLAIIAIAPLHPLTSIFLVLFINWWMISQELHKYAHMRTIPPALKRMQDMGIILSRKEHGQHHTAPFEDHYCILTGVCNSFLDKSRFFRYMENIVFRLTGNKPNTWKEDPAVERESMNIFSKSRN